MLIRALRRGFASKVYTIGWNHNNMGGYEEPKDFNVESRPVRLALQEDKQVQKIVIGYSESVILNQDGSYYNFGTEHLFLKNSDKPVLGSDISDSLRDIDVDYSHAIFLTKDGRILEQDKKGVKDVRLEGDIHSVACGNGFSLAVIGNEHGTQKVVAWATGAGCHPSVFCSGEVPSSPVEIQSLSQLIHTDNTRIKKLKVVDNSIAVLLENGVLAVWGNNRAGNLGIPRPITLMHEVYVEDVKVPFIANRINDFVTDFDMSSNNIVILSEKGDLYYAGRDKDLKLEKLPFFSDKRVASVGSYHNNYVIVTDKGELFTTEAPQGEVRNKYWGDYQLYQYDQEYFENAKVVSVSGKYDNAFALTA